MDLVDTSKLIGVQIVLALPALFFLLRAAQARLPSRRYANFALACGLAALIVPERLLALSAADYPGIFVAIGIARVLLGLAGLVLAALALSRRADGGAGSPRLLLATVGSAAHAIMGIASLTYADATLPGPPQTYRSPDGAFQLTLSSSRWEETAKPKTVVAFSHSRPVMLVKVRTVSRDQSREDFDALALLMIERIETVPWIKGLKMEDGVTESGNHYRYFSGPSQTPEGTPVYAAYSVVWSPRTKVLAEISFEGTPRANTAADRLEELQTMQQAARLICLSVE